MTQRPKTFPEDLELYYFHIVYNHASTFSMFLLLHLQHWLTNSNHIYPILKHCSQKLIQKHICTVRNVENRHENVGNSHINIFKTSTALLNHVKAVHTGHLQQYCFLHYSQHGFKNY